MNISDHKYKYFITCHISIFLPRPVCLHKKNDASAPESFSMRALEERRGILCSGIHHQLTTAWMKR